MRSESGLLYIEASGDGQLEKVLGDTSWLPLALRTYETNLIDVLPALDGAHALGRMELDFVELLPDLFVDIQYQFDDGRHFVWLRDTSRHAAHLRAAQQVANQRALKEAVAGRWLDDIRRENSHMRVILDALPTPVAYWSPAGQLMFANRRFEALMGRSTDDRVASVRFDAPEMGVMEIESNVWVSTQALRGFSSISFVRTQLTGVTASKLVADLSPAGEVTGFLDVTEYLQRAH